MPRKLWTRPTTKTRGGMGTCTVEDRACAQRAPVILHLAVGLGVGDGLHLRLAIMLVLQGVGGAISSKWSENVGAPHRQEASRSPSHSPPQCLRSPLRLRYRSHRLERPPPRFAHPNGHESIGRTDTTAAASPSGPGQIAPAHVAAPHKKCQSGRKLHTFLSRTASTRGRRRLHHPQGSRTHLARACFVATARRVLVSCPLYHGLDRRPGERR